MLLSKSVKGLSVDENVCVGAANFLNFFLSVGTPADCK